MPTDAILPALCIAGFAGLVLLAAVNDIASMEIPNWISIALAVSFPVAGLLGGMSGGAIALHLGAGALMFLLGFGLFSIGILGGGDVKVISAASVWIGFAGMPDFFFFMSLAGGLLAGFLLLARRAMQPREDRPAFLNRLLAPANGIPYAVAIAAGALYALPSSPLAVAILAGSGR